MALQRLPNIQPCKTLSPCDVAQHTGYTLWALPKHAARASAGKSPQKCLLASCKKAPVVEASHLCLHTSNAHPWVACAGTQMRRKTYIKYQVQEDRTCQITCYIGVTLSNIQDKDCMGINDKLQPCGLQELVKVVSTLFKKRGRYHVDWSNYKETFFRTYPSL